MNRPNSKVSEVLHVLVATATAVYCGRLTIAPRPPVPADRTFGEVLARNCGLFKGPATLEGAKRPMLNNSCLLDLFAVPSLSCDEFTRGRPNLVVPGTGHYMKDWCCQVSTVLLQCYGTCHVCQNEFSIGKTLFGWLSWLVAVLAAS